VGLKQTRKIGRRKLGHWKYPEAAFKEKHGLNKQGKEDDEGGGPWECPEAVFKEKGRVLKNKEKRTTKVGAPGIVLRLYSKRNMGLKQTRTRE
jgi:hypothetical protein